MEIESILNIVRETDAIFFDERLRADVAQKGESDYVTKADIEISKYVQRRLKEEFPDVGFVSEEGNTEIDIAKDYWILDPIDGTTNFMHGIGLCGLSLALYSKGEIAFGVIYVPYARELFYAEKGKGAYLNGNPIRCSDKARLSDCIGMMEYNAYYKSDLSAALSQASKIYSACQDIRTFGSAAVELAYIACGRADVFLGRYLKPWDYAAGVLLIEEAGGKAADLNGALQFSEWKRHIIATNSNVYDEFKRTLCGEAYTER